MTRNGQISILNQTEEQKRNDDHFNFYMGGDYYFNKKNTLTVSYYKHIIENTDELDLEYSYSNPASEIDSVISQFENYSEPQNFKHDILPISERSLTSPHLSGSTVHSTGTTNK